MNMRKYALGLQKGFTLVELLVVVAIIGLLAGIAIVSVNSVRIKARDTRRIADIKQIQNALELYNNEHGGMYPASGADLKLGRNTNDANDPMAITSAGIKETPAADETVYLNVVPHDPTDGKEYLYLKDIAADVNRLTYTMTFTTEGTTSLGAAATYKATPTGIAP
ncbi:MAG: type II secretion system protein [Patescibacteria group bacterium]